MEVRHWEVLKIKIFGQKSTSTFMAIPVVEFSRDEYKIRKIFG
jgi:hypothetical protein